LAILLLAAMLAMPAGAKPVALIGLVVDEEGRPLDGVRVDVVSDGQSIASTTTAATGYFQVTVELNQVYTLLLWKPGFEEKNITVQATVSGTQNVGTIVLRYGISIKLYADTLQVKQGDTVEIPFIVINSGRGEERVEAVVQAPPRWLTGVLDEYGLSVKRFYVSPRSTRDLRLRVSVPRNESGIHDLVLSLISSVHARNATFTFVVEKRDWELLTLLYTGVFTYPGGTVSIPLKLVNVLEETTTINILVDLPGGWSYWLSKGGERLMSITLEPGQHDEAVLSVRVPSYAKADIYVVKITAVAGDAVSTRELQVEVVRGADELSIESGIRVVDVISGTSASIDITVTNMGTGSTIVYFDVAGLPAGYAWSIRDEAGNLISALYLPPQSSKKMLLDVQVPAGEPSKALSFRLSAKGASSEATLELGLNIKGRPAVKVSPDNWVVEGSAGIPARFEIVVQNVGDIPVMQLSVGVGEGLPRGITISVSPDSVSRLDPQASASFTFLINIGAEVPPGRYYIPVTLTGTGVRQNYSLVLNVGLRSEALYLTTTLAILIASTLAIAAIYRRGIRPGPSPYPGEKAAGSTRGN